MPEQEADVLTRNAALERPIELLDAGGDRLQHAAQAEDLDPVSAAALRERRRMANMRSNLRPVISA